MSKYDKEWVIFESLENYMLEGKASNLRRECWGFLFPFIRDQTGV